MTELDQHDYGHTTCISAHVNQELQTDSVLGRGLLKEKAMLKTPISCNRSSCQTIISNIQQQSVQPLLLMMLFLGKKEMFLGPNCSAETVCLCFAVWLPSVYYATAILGLHAGNLSSDISLRHSFASSTASTKKARCQVP